MTGSFLKYDMALNTIYIYIYIYIYLYIFIYIFNTLVEYFDLYTKRNQIYKYKIRKN